MRRTALPLTLVVLLSLLRAPEVLGGSGAAGDASTGKTSGPAVSATVVMNPTFGSPTKGQTTVRFSKGSAHSGALFQHAEAADAPPTGWVLGCNGVDGANLGDADPTLNVNTLTTLRFVNNRIRSWIPHDVLNALFTQLGIPFNDSTRIPVITDVDNPRCTQVGTDFFLSFNAVMQFETQ